MAKTHTVAQGEFLAKIARNYGFTNWQTIWDAPENKDLKDKRKNPNILFPGDKLVIPDKETREETKATEQKHKFELQTEPLKVRIVLMGLKSKPLEGHECTLTIESDSEKITTKSDGKLEMTVTEKASQGRLVDLGKPGPQFRTERQIPLRIGDLDPVDKVSGQIARLNNLGYAAGDIPDHTLTENEEDTIRKSLPFRSAVEEFQCDFSLKVDGICGEKTQKKLEQVHGC
jgi:N-acetylmuramoyl-L-alanine amidase